MKHYQVGKRFEINSKSIFVFVECSDPDIRCLNAECVETTDPLLPVFCQCYDGSRRDPQLNVTCPLSTSF